MHDTDRFGKLIAPLFSHEFMLKDSGGVWGIAPRHIARHDQRYFEVEILFCILYFEVEILKRQLCSDYI